MYRQSWLKHTESTAIFMIIASYGNTGNLKLAGQLRVSWSRFQFGQFYGPVDCTYHVCD